jgi:hypothetical protein
MKKTINNKMEIIEHLNKYFNEMVTILKDRYHILEKRRLVNSDPDYETFLGDEEFHTADKKFSDLLLRAKMKNLDVEKLEERHNNLLGLIGSPKGNDDSEGELKNAVYRMLKQ